ncbi:MAG TPA: hypothetical protein VHX38_21980 [Pseudonocardiaceae bacterium]|nr:hypothetical protein [Pseudonocardiaceae bacterium]
MDLDQLRKRCRRRLADVVIPEPFSLQRFRAQVAESRGRPLHLHSVAPRPASGTPCGMWLATAGADHVFYVSGSSALHQQNIILHEIGHMLWDHALDVRSDLLAGLLPDLDPNVVTRTLLRTSYSAPQEQEAEMMAAVILERAGWPSAGARPSGVLARLQEVFEPRRRGRRHGD